MFKKKDILQNGKSRGCSKWLVALIVLICTASDFITIYTFSASTFNETPIISIVVSIVSAICLDASLGYAAILMNRCTSTSSPAVRSRCRVLVGLLVAVFAIAYAGLILLAWSDASRTDTDLVTSGTLTRLLLPTATSILSFVMGLALNPNDERLSQIDSQLAELNRELDVTTATAQRLQSAFSLYDPSQYDLEQYRLAVARLKAHSNAAAHEIRLMLAQELGTADVTNQLLSDSSSEELYNQIEELGLQLETAPKPECHAGAIPAFDTEQPAPAEEQVLDEQSEDAAQEEILAQADPEDVAA